MKIFCLIIFFALGAYGLYLDVLNFNDMFGNFGIILGVAVGLGKIGTPILAYDNKNKNAQLTAVCAIVWAGLVVISGYNTTQYVKKHASEQMLLSPEHLALQEQIDLKTSEIQSETENRSALNARTQPTFVRLAGERIKALSDEKKALQDQYNALEVKDITASDFIKNQNTIGWIGAFVLEFLTVLFAVGAKTYDEENNEDNSPKNKYKYKPLNNKIASPSLILDNGQAIPLHQIQQLLSFMPNNQNQQYLYQQNNAQNKNNEYKQQAQHVNTINEVNISRNEEAIQPVNTVNNQEIKSVEPVSSINNTAKSNIDTSIEIATCSENIILSEKQQAVRKYILTGKVDNSWRNLQKFFLQEEYKHLKLSQQEAKQVKDYMLIRKELVKNELHAGFALNPSLQNTNVVNLFNV